jgi:hypothetical protein
MDNKWSNEEKEELLQFAQASDHENNQDMFEYISDMLRENGYNRTPSQIKSMYYRICKTI